MKPEILSLCALPPAVQPELDARFVVHRLDLAFDRDALLAQVRGAIRGLLAEGGARVDAALLDRLPALEFVSCTSAGYEGIDTRALAHRGIRMGNCSRGLDDDVADTAILLLLAARRDLVRGHVHVTFGNWATGDFPLLHSFTGGRLGIAGMGHVGQAVAHRARAFGKEIGYFTRAPKAEVAGLYFIDLAALASWCDELVLCLPGGAQTRHVVGARVLEALGPRGVLVNVARGSVVDEGALMEALRSGGLGAAGLDVFENEPKPNPDLVSLPNVTAYPHHASGTVETHTAIARLALDNLVAFFENRLLPCEVALPV